MIQRSLLGLAAMLCPALLAGCGLGGDESAEAESTATAKRSDLPAMVLPRSELGELGRGLLPDRAEFGWEGNRETAKGTIDRHDTGRSLARAGRLVGYQAGYARPGGLRPRTRGSVYSIETDVELFRDDAAASAYLDEQVAQLEENRGRRRQGVLIADIARFDAGDLADEAVGLTITVTNGDATVFETGVAFRRGRIVGSADIVQQADPERVELDFSDEAKGLAEALDERIQDVISGSETTRPVRWRGPDPARRGPDPRKLALRPKDFSLSMTLTHQRHIRLSILNGYLREYDVSSPVRLGGSEILYFRSLAKVFTEARLAERDRRYLASARGSRTVARRLVRGFFRRTDFTPGPVEAHPLPSPGRDSAAFEFSLAVPKGRLRTVVVSVRRGRLMTSVGAMGLEPKVDPTDVMALIGKLRERLRAAG